MHFVNDLVHLLDGLRRFGIQHGEGEDVTAGYFPLNCEVYRNSHNNRKADSSNEVLGSVESHHVFVMTELRLSEQFRSVIQSLLFGQAHPRSADVGQIAKHFSDGPAQTRLLLVQRNANALLRVDLEDGYGGAHRDSSRHCRADRPVRVVCKVQCKRRRCHIGNALHERHLRELDQTLHGLVQPHRQIAHATVLQRVDAHRQQVLGLI
mmetsp:Transcript_38209/g.43615  ORF Transcript_38209/g.43615 Transcript_38209/m.43615 type:complete len:208 (+) Transcript_38209:922-1545(+)